MANRGADSAVIAEWDAEQNRPVHLIRVEFSTTVVTITDAYKDIDYNGETYTALGHFLSFSDIQETTELQVTNMIGQLSGIDQSMISIILGEQYIDRPVNVYLAMCASDWSVVSDPVLIFGGRINKPSIAEDPDAGTSIVSIEASNHLSDFERRPGRHTNDSEQQALFPGDRGFEFTSVLNKVVKWGQE